MKRNILTIFVLTLMTLPSIAAEKEKKKGGPRGAQGQNVAAQLIKQLEPVGLTDEQKQKITEMGKTVSTEMKKIRDENGITPELMKKRAEAAKSLAQSDKKGKEREEAINEAAGFTKEHTQAMAKANSLRAEFTKKVVALLTDEQKENLPKQLLRAGAKRGNKPGNKPGKKKEAA